MMPVEICAIVRNEAAYIAEWVAFHRVVGVSGFTIYDDRSDDGTLDVLRRMDRGDIRVSQYSEGWHSPEFYGLEHPGGWHRSPQACAYTNYAVEHWGLNKWCAYIDVDEFLFHTSIDDLPFALSICAASDAPGIVVPWSVFGSNGHATRPDGLVIENYASRATAGQPEPWGRHVKTIADMRELHAWGPHGSHCPIFQKGEPETPEGQPNPWSMVPRPIVPLGLRLNHYYHKSKAEAEAKLARVDHNALPGYPSRERVEAHDLNDIEDLSITRFIPRVKEELARCA